MLCTESRNVVCRMGKYTLCKRVCALLCPEILPRVLRVSGSAAQNELTTCFSLVKSKPTWLHHKELNSEITQSLPMERFAIDVCFLGANMHLGVPSTSSHHTQHPHSPEHGHIDTAVKLWFREVTKRSRDHGGVHEGLGRSVLGGRHRFPRLQLDLTLQVQQVFIYLLPSAVSGRTGSRKWKTND